MNTFFIGFIALRLLLTAIFILGLYKIATHIIRKHRNLKGSKENRGITILKERLASGEINEEKYRTMSEVLKN